MNAAIELAAFSRGGPFGAIVVLDDCIIGAGQNQVVSTHDPTAHAEIVAIRQACNHLGSHTLENCILYSSCEPCPMCLAACYWAGIHRIFYAANRQTAARIGFNDAHIERELQRTPENRTVPATQGPLALVLRAEQILVHWNGKLY